MSILTEASEVSYTGNSLTTAFPVPYKFTSPSDLVVTLTTDTTEELQELATDYSVVGTNVVMNAAPASGVGVRIERTLPLTQPSTYPNSGPFYPSTWEGALDRKVMMIQQVDRQTKDNALAIQAVAEDLVDTESEVYARLSLELTAVRSELNTAPGSTVDTRTVLAISGTSARALNKRFADTGLTPYDFGATGDGVANDTTALTLLAAYGGPVIIPRGTFKHTSTLNFAQYVEFRGGTLQASGGGVVANFNGGYSNLQAGSNQIRAWGRLLTGSPPTILAQVGVVSAVVDANGIIVTLTRGVLDGSSCAIKAYFMNLLNIPFNVDLTCEQITATPMTQFKIHAYNGSGYIDLNASVRNVAFDVLGLT
jgi:hypothetical protein